MKVKVQKVVNDIVEIIKLWDGVQTVILQHFVEKDIYDPHFSITLDVFRDSRIPDKVERAVAFPNIRYFETSSSKEKDRFLMEDLPVRISYKDTSRVENVLELTCDDRWLSRERGTYLFHRISTGTVVWSRTDWIDKILERLDNLPDVFWSTWIESCHRRIDHFLGDLGAATMKNDLLYFRLSLSGFLRVIVEILFAINHMFESGPRVFTASLALMEVLPEGFEASWESLLREDESLPPHRKKEIADILARGVFALRQLSTNQA